MLGLCGLAACRPEPSPAAQPPQEARPSAPAPASTPNSAPTPNFEDELLADASKILSAQERYAYANGGYFDSNMQCLVAPARCIPGYAGDGETFLAADAAFLSPIHGYVRTLHTSPALDTAIVERARVSPTSVEGVAYTAVPAMTEARGLRALCVDLDLACYASDGILPPVTDGRCPRPVAKGPYACIGIVSPASSLSELRQMRRERAEGGADTGR